MTNPPGSLEELEVLLEEYAASYSNWGRWGPDDQRGTTNLITPAVVRAAVSEVHTGQVIPLAMPIDQHGPQTGRNGRFNPLRYSTSTGTDHEAGVQMWDGAAFPHGIGFADDLTVMHLQTGTHWDSLSHVFHRGLMYNGFPAGAVSAEGAARNGTEQLRGTLVGRGVLLDVPRALGVEHLEDGYPITADDLDVTAEHQGVELRSGDIVLLRTGKLARARREGWGGYAGGDAPGLSIRTVPWLHRREVAAVAADTWGVEVRPNEFAGAYQPMHVPALVHLGLPFGEMFDLEELAAACLDDGRYACLVSAPPLGFVGTGGAPPAPVAIR